MDELVKFMLTQRVPAEGVLPATRQQQLSSDELGSTSYVENVFSKSANCAKWKDENYEYHTSRSL